MSFKGPKGQRGDSFGGLGTVASTWSSPQRAPPLCKGVEGLEKSAQPAKGDKKDVYLSYSGPWVGKKCPL